MPDNIFEALRESHELQRSLCRKLLRSPPHSGRRIALSTDRGLDPSRHALHEHHEVDERVEDLQVVDHNGRHWMATARRLSEKVHHHLREEEEKFFHLAGKILPASRKAALAGKYRRDHARMLKVLRAS